MSGSAEEVLESLSDLFRRQQLCDVTFVVGPERQRIGAHRVILGGRSAVFKAQFFGGLRESVDAARNEPYVLLLRLRLHLHLHVFLCCLY